MERTYSGISRRQESVLRNLDTIGGLLDRDERESDLACPVGHELRDVVSTGLRDSSPQISRASISVKVTLVVDRAVVRQYSV